MTRLLLALVLLTSCTQGWDARDGWVDEGDPTAVPADTARVYEAARAVAPCEIDPWGGWVEWFHGPFMCGGPGGVLAAGCFDGAPEMKAHLQVVGVPWRDVARDTALPHELGHYVNNRCYGPEEAASEDAADAFAFRVRVWLDTHPPTALP